VDSHDIASFGAVDAAAACELLALAGLSRPAAAA
jgi:hypothetical protein